MPKLLTSARNVGFSSLLSTRFLFTMTDYLYLATYKAAPAHRRRSAEQPLARSDAKSPAKATSRCPCCSQVRLSSAYFAWGRYLSVLFFYICECLPVFIFYICSLARSTREDLACYLHDILYHIFTSLLLNNDSFMAYFAWGRAII